VFLDREFHNFQNEPVCGEELSSGVDAAARETVGVNSLETVTERLERSRTRGN
jgi:hypothetical protein